MSTQLFSHPTNKTHGQHQAFGKLLLLELKKLKRKHMLITFLAMTAFYFICIYYSIRSQLKFSSDAHCILFNAAIYSTMVMPILITVLCTTLFDLEQSHNMENELRIYLAPKEFFNVKWIFSVMSFICYGFLQTVMYSIFSQLIFGAGNITISEFIYHFATSSVVNIMLITLMQVVMLKTRNQFSSTIFGLTLSLTGLFGVILEPNIAHLIPSSYYVFLSTVTISMTESGTDFVLLDTPWVVLVGVCIFTAILFIVSKYLYLSQEY